MTRYEAIYHQKETDKEFRDYYYADSDYIAAMLAWGNCESDEYLYITNTETGETFLVDDGATLAAVPEV